MSIEEIPRLGRTNPLAKKFLSVYDTGRARFSTPAAEAWLADVDHVGVGLDAEQRSIRFAYGADGAQYRLHRACESGGASVYLTTLLAEIGIDPEAIDATLRLELDHDPAAELVVADADPLFQEVDR